MKFSEELTMVGELELTDSELETICGGDSATPPTHPYHHYHGGGRYGRYGRDDDFGGYFGWPEFWEPPFNYDQYSQPEVIIIGPDGRPYPYGGY